jgi:hypothetical protein
VDVRMGVWAHSPRKTCGSLDRPAHDRGFAPVTPARQADERAGVCGSVLALSRDGDGGHGIFRVLSGSTQARARKACVRQLRLSAVVGKAEAHGLKANRNPVAIVLDCQGPRVEAGFRRPSVGNRSI